MAWLSRNNFTPSDKLHADDLNNLANDDRTWGGDVNGGGHILSNVQLVGIIETAVAVSSVFGRTGDVIAVTGDYTPDQVGAVPLTRLVSPGVGLSGGGALSADITLSVAPDTTNQRVAILSEGVAVATRPAMNFEHGANVTVTITDNPGANRVDVAISSTGGGGGMVDPTTTIGDLIVRGSAAPNRLPIGLDGQVLTADSTSTLHVKWAAASVGSSQTPWLSNIDGGGFTLSNVTALSLAGTGGDPSLSARSGQFFVAGKVAGIAIEMGTQEASPFAAWIQSKFFGSDGRSFALSLQPLGGNVGIGLTAPAYKLHVTGGGVGAASSFDPSQNVANTICIQDTGAGLYNGGALLFGAGQGLFAAIHGLLTDGSNYTAGAIGFYTRSSPAVLAIAEVMRIMPGGNVGIGNTGPLRSLDLTGGMAERTWSLGAPGSGDLDVTNKGLLAVYGAGTTTFTGLIGGVDGARVTIVNCMASNITFMPSSSSSASQNQIRMTSGAASLIVKPNGSATFVWTVQFNQWFLVTYFSV